MWEKQLATVSSKYDVAKGLAEPFSTRLNGIPKYDKPKMLMRKPMRWSGKAELSSFRLQEEKKEFGISLTGIKAGKEEISIEPERLERNVFYLFSYHDEKYVARKSGKDIVEIYEVIE